MIGYAWKKFAKENGLTVSGGVAYGSLRGFAATLSEGAGYKQIVLTTRFAAETKQNALRELISQRDISKEFRVQNMSFAPNGISIVFLDNPGTMKKIEAFLDWFLPLLVQYGAGKAEICTECGMPVESGKWVLRDGVAAFYMHDACADKVVRDVEASNEQRKEADTGSYLKGALGALVGALIGSIAWAILYSLGILAAIAGFVIGWLANKLYDVFKGKQGKGKIAILVVAVILGVLLGTFLGLSINLGSQILSGEWPVAEHTLLDVPAIILVLLIAQQELLTSVIRDVLIGLLFAGLGVFTLLRNANRQVADEKVIILK